jgi:hypothetical protein
MKVNYLTSFMFAAMALCMTVGFASCDDDEQVESTAALTDVDGSYSGMMTLIPAPASRESVPDGPAVNAAVKNDTIEFKDLDIASLMAAIPGMGVVNNVDYKLGFKAAFGKDQKTINLQFDPTPLETTMTTEDGEVPITVTIAATEQGVFTYEGSQLALTLQATKVEVAGEEQQLPGVLPLSIGFVLHKKTK